ncbi:Transmembrane amino acid transporter protein [Tritrichomonas foetus]|uniref:Transmembrane amino acid transporter protein n=1 Tax=Tritrichomonas foetus TaxID=1144522 RepID=A0A1J4L021_9EUKA|nr:Transmembrane amino acid transporter protein [Tritrichomonas foetus]|eukprot:OHT15284.1 Transmembrane amino acid transporter protein [Tritrichomonas foetus]
MHPEDNVDAMFLSRKGSLSFWDLVIVGVNSAVGMAALRLGSTFHSGFFLSIFLYMFIAAFSFYAIQLYIWSAAHFHESTYEEIWTEAFSNKTAVICGFCSIYSTFLFLADYVQIIQQEIIDLINIFAPNVNSSVKSPYTIGLILMALFFVPISLSSSLRAVVNISIFQVITYAILLVYVVARFAISVKNEGFDPNHQFSYFRFDIRASNDVATLIFAYVIFPFAWPGMRHSQQPTIKNITNVFKTIISIVFVSYLVMGIFSYLTFFDENTGGIIIEYYPNDTLSIIMKIVAIFFILFSCPLLLNNIRYIILNVIDKTDNFPKNIWSMMGVCITFIAVILANLTDKYMDVIYIIGDVFSSLLVFIFPATFYLRGFGRKVKFHFVMSIIVIIVGIICAVFVTFRDSMNYG